LDVVARPAHGDLERALRALVVGKRGVDRFEIRKQPVLLDLACVRDHAAAKVDDVLVLEESLRGVLFNACQALVPKERASAALGLLGLVAATRGRNVTARRSYAASLLGYEGERGWDAFRGRYERDLIRDVAAELYLHEREYLAHKEMSVLPRGSASAGEGPQYPEVGRGYALIGYALTYHVRRDDYRAHFHSREYEIEATRPSPNPFKHWYKWSGTGVESLPVVVSPNHRIVGDLQRSEEGLAHFYVQLDERLQIGERTIIRLEQDLYDSKQSLKPILSTRNPDSALEWLTLRVILPMDRPPSKVTYGIWSPRHAGEDLVYAKDGKSWVDEELKAIVLEWSPTELRYDHRYAIQWAYADGEGVYPLNYEPPSDRNSLPSSDEPSDRYFKSDPSTRAQE
jgi:hypothetical protein